MELEHANPNTDNVVLQVMYMICAFFLKIVKNEIQNESHTLVFLRDSLLTTSKKESHIFYFSHENRMNKCSS